MFTIERTLLSQLIDIADNYIDFLQEERMDLLGRYHGTPDDGERASLHGRIDELDFHLEVEVVEPKMKAWKILHEGASK